jgi:excinuclease ABC subunit C
MSRPLTAAPASNAAGKRRPPRHAVPGTDAGTLIAGLPGLPGVYRMLDADGQALYVGKAKNLKKRVASYFQKGDLSPRIVLMMGKVASVEVTVTRTEAEALLLENNLIKSLKPRYNILFRDDKSYPYLLLSAHAFPRLAYFRGTPEPGAHVFGPFPSAYAVRESMHILQQVFRLRTCEDTVFAHRSRPCLLHQIHRCTAPCVDLIDARSYRRDVVNALRFLEGRENELVDELGEQMHAAANDLRFEEAALLREQIRNLARVREKQYVESFRVADADALGCVIRNGVTCVSLIMFRGGRRLGDRNYFPGNAGNADEAEVLEAFASQHYLESPAPPLIVVSHEADWKTLSGLLARQHRRRVRITAHPDAESRQWINMALTNAEVALIRHLSEHATQEARLTALRDALALPGLSRIECFDISHTGGEAAQAACVVFDQGTMQKAEYRRFNMRNISPADDYGAMNEALNRRYRRIVEGDGKLPDLVLIDGGKGQVNAALAALSDLGLNDTAVIGVAKGESRKPGLERLIFPERNEALKLPHDHPGLHLIQAIRDEAHRFAITGHRARRGKARTRSALEDIEGVGAKRRQKLLASFGGLRGVMAADLEALARVEGISRKLAEKIFRELH